MLPLLLLLGAGLYIATRKSEPTASSAPGSTPASASPAATADENAGRETVAVVPVGPTFRPESSFGTSGSGGGSGAATPMGATPLAAEGVGVKPVLSTTADWPGSRALPLMWRLPALGLLSLVAYDSVKPAIDAGGKLSILKVDDAWVAGVVCPSGKCPSASDARKLYEGIAEDFTAIETAVGRKVAERAVYEVLTVAKTLTRRENGPTYEPVLPFTPSNGTAGGGL